MSKTYKDKKPNNGGPIRTKQTFGEKIFSRRFENFKRFGPSEPRDYFCPYCGGDTDFENGYLVCHDCGGVDAICRGLFLYETAA